MSTKMPVMVNGCARLLGNGMLVSSKYSDNGVFVLLCVFVDVVVGVDAVPGAESEDTGLERGCLCSSLFGFSG